MIDRKVLIKRLLFAAYFVAAFFLFLLLLFPFDRIKSRLETEVRNRTPLELSITGISPRFFNRFVLSDVILSDGKGRVLFESPSIYTKVSICGLLRGLLAVSVDAKAYGGELLVSARQESKQQSISIDANELDIGAYPLLKDLGVKVSGKLGGNFEMTGNSGKGRLWAKDLATRELTVQGFPLPDLDFSRGWLEAELKGDRATVKKLELEGKDLKLRVTGSVVLRQRGTLNLIIKVKPSERLAREQALVFSMLKKKDAEGFYQFILGGTLDKPVPRI
jgi:type II secretion system protein N